MGSQRTAVCIAAAVCLVGAAGAYAVEPGDGWVTGEHWEEAVEHARETGRPLAIVYAIPDSTCPLHNASAQNFMRHRGLSDAVRVLVYTDDVPDDFRGIQRQMEDVGRLVPRLFVTDSQMEVVTLVKYEQRDELNQRVQLAGEVLRWRKQSERDLARVDELAEQGRFRQAVEIVERIGKEDQRVSVRIGRMADPRESGEDSGEADAPPEGVFFPGLIADRHAALARKASAWVDEARTLADREEYREARNHLVRLVRDRSDLPAVEEARELLDEIAATMRQQARAER